LYCDTVIAVDFPQISSTYYTEVLESLGEQKPNRVCASRFWWWLSTRCCE